MVDSICDGCPSKMWCLVSGGKDSMTTAHVLSTLGRLEGVVFLDTGISVGGLVDHVRSAAAEFGWAFEVYRTPDDYDAMVRQYGFPGPAGHSKTMARLKLKSLYQFKKKHPRSPIASGVRTGESSRRFVNAKAIQTLEGIPTFAPIVHWSTESVLDYVRSNGLPLSPAYRTLHISGDCLCGAFAHPNEITALKLFYPTEAERIHKLEHEIASNPTFRDSIPPRNRWGWKGLRLDSLSIEETFLCGSCYRSVNLEERW